MKNPKLKD